MGQSKGNSGAPDPFSDGGHRTGTDGAAINAAIWELSDHGQRAAAVREVAQRAGLGAGWLRANGHLDFWHNARGFMGRLPSGQRFRPDRIGQGQHAQWALIEIPSSTLIQRPDWVHERQRDDTSFADVQKPFAATASPSGDVQPDHTCPAPPEEVEGNITAMYGQLAELYAQLEPEMGGHAIGARILISPPRVRADVMFIAYQPGDTSGFPQERGCDSRWPDENEYATRDWDLATAVRRIVTPQILEAHTVVTNVVFWRAHKKEAWIKAPRAARKMAEAFSLKQVRRLIELLQPKAIVAIGFDAFDVLKPTKTVVRHHRKASDGRIDRVVSTGEVAGCPIVGTLHLSAQMSNADRDLIAIAVQALFPA